jgi:GDP-L-fucose synthase
MRVYIAGHKGLVGSALVKIISERNNFDLITVPHSEMDLTNQLDVSRFFKKEKPDWVFLAAARVGGIHANSSYPVEFLLDNLKVQNNVIQEAAENNVEKLLFLGSSCIYPRLSVQPIKEECLLTSALEETNEAYAIAKIAGIKLCDAYRKEYLKNFLSVMPTNLYGPNDNYHTENAHALPMLLRRFHEAKLNNSSVVKVWGTGKPMREFMFSEDLASACLFLMDNYSANEIDGIVNIGTGIDCSIADLADLIADVVGFKGAIEYDFSKPDGTPRKLLDVSKLNKLGWVSRTTLKEGLEKTYLDFLTNKSIRK